MPSSSNFDILVLNFVGKIKVEDLEKLHKTFKEMGLESADSAILGMQYSQKYIQTVAAAGTQINKYQCLHGSIKSWKESDEVICASISIVSVTPAIGWLDYLFSSTGQLQNMCFQYVYFGQSH